MQDPGDCEHDKNKDWKYCESCLVTEFVSHMPRNPSIDVYLKLYLSDFIISYIFICLSCALGRDAGGYIQLAFIYVHFRHG